MPRMLIRLGDFVYLECSANLITFIGASCETPLIITDPGTGTGRPIPWDPILWRFGHISSHPIKDLVPSLIVPNRWFASGNPPMLARATLRVPNSQTIILFTFCYLFKNFTTNIVMKSSMLILMRSNLIAAILQLLEYRFPHLNSLSIYIFFSACFSCCWASLTFFSASSRSFLSLFLTISRALHAYRTLPDCSVRWSFLWHQQLRKNSRGDGSELPGTLISKSPCLIPGLAQSYRSSCNLCI